jgi:hypothetical protein
MTRTLVAVAVLGLLAGSLVAVDDPPATPPDPLAALVGQLGHDDFARREEAEKRLGELGPDALPALREAAASDNPEVARRAGRALARLTRRVENEKLLAPKFVTLNAENVALDAVLAELSKQSGHDVVIGGSTADALAGRPVTVKTNGKVPFWEAVLAVCDSADLKIASVAGYLASDAAKQLTGPRGAKARAPVTASSVFLEPRNGARRRPAAVFGAVCVEAVPVPEAVATADASVAILQVWPEPGLDWQSTAAIRLDRATDAAGQARLVEPAGPPLAAPQVVRGNNVVVVNQVNGGVVLVNPNARVPAPAATAAPFTPSTRQFVMKLKPGARPAAALTEFRGTLIGTVRVGPEPLITLSALSPDRSAEGEHPAGADMRATLRKDAGGKWRATVDLNYDTSRVQLADSGGKLGNLINGVRVTDAAGNAYLTVPTSMSQTVRGGSTRQTLRMECDLHPTRLQGGPPVAVTLWAVFGKSVEVPVSLTNVPVASGAR